MTGRHGSMLAGLVTPEPHRAGHAGRSKARRPFASLRIASTVAEAAEAWSHLEAIVPASPYQQRSWLAAWIETEGRAAQVTVMIVIAQDAAGTAVALIPLGIRGGRLLRVASFLGGRETNYNMGLFDPTLDWSPADAAHLVRAAARQLRADMVVLTHQPLNWQGFRNPLAAMPRSQPSPSFNHRGVLSRDGEAFMRQHQSGTARKKLRAKAAHLATLGPVSHRVARTPAEIDAVIAVHLDQKAAKLAAIGLALPDRTGLHRLFSRAATATEDGPAALELHALHCGDTIVATFGGLSHQGRFSGLVISYAVEPCYARSSPGELLLTAVIKAKCAEGFDCFDLGIGEARYKETYCPIADPLVDVFMPLTVLGHVSAAAEALRLRVKSAIKRSPAAWALAKAVRRKLRGSGLPAA